MRHCKTALILLLVLCQACATGVVTGDDESWRDCGADLNSYTRTLAGGEFTDCGFFTVDSSEFKKNTVTYCARKTWSKEGAVRFGHRTYGDDSALCDSAVRDNTGKVWSVYFDYDISGGRGGPPALWISECKSLEFKAGTIAPDSFFDTKDCTLREDISKSLLLASGDVQ